MTTAADEARHSPALASFAAEHNKRVTSEVRKGQRWVRVRPADKDDFEMVEKDRRTLPFVRPGSACFVLDVNPLLVRCGADSVIFGMDYFLGSFIRLVEEDEWLRDQRRGR